MIDKDLSLGRLPEIRIIGSDEHVKVSHPFGYDVQAAYAAAEQSNAKDKEEFVNEYAQRETRDPQSPARKLETISKVRAYAESKRDADAISKTHFTFIYVATPAPAAKAAFEYAAQLLSVLYDMDTRFPVRVRTTFANLGTGVLGGAGGGSAISSDIVYPIALANQLNGGYISNNPDISASFSTAANWYYGTDGNGPNNQYDFVTVVMHELLHGMGYFMGFQHFPSPDRLDHIGVYQFQTTRPNAVYVLDQYTRVTPGTAGALGVAANVSFRSLSATKRWQVANVHKSIWTVLPNGRVGYMYTVESFSPLYSNGSSISHLDEETYDPAVSRVNALMTYAVGLGEANHHPGPIVMDSMDYMGYNVRRCSLISGGCSACVAQYCAYCYADATCYDPGFANRSVACTNATNNCNSPLPTNTARPTIGGSPSSNASPGGNVTSSASVTALGVGLLSGLMMLLA